MVVAIDTVGAIESVGPVRCGGRLLVPIVLLGGKEAAAKGVDQLKVGAWGARLADYGRSARDDIPACDAF